MNLKLFFYLSSLVLVSCVLKHQKTENTLLINGGYEITKDHPGYYSSVAIAEGERFMCSGVIIANNLALTAAHCFKPSSGFNAPPIDLNNIFLYFGDPKTGWVAKHHVTEIRSFRNFHKDQDIYDSFTTNFDIAWLRFEDPLPVGYQSIDILPDVNRLVGQSMSVVGYGNTNIDSNDMAKNLLGVDLDIDNYFDEPHAQGIILTKNTEEKGLCHGDSGGPGFIKVDGNWYLAGIVKGRSPKFGQDTGVCSGGAIFTSTTYYKGWIEETANIKLAGNKGNVIDETWPNQPPLHSTFLEYCLDRELPKSLFFYLDNLLFSLRAPTCELASNKIGSLKEVTIYNNEQLAMVAAWKNQLDIERLEIIKKLTDQEIIRGYGIIPIPIEDSLIGNFDKIKNLSLQYISIKSSEFLQKLSNLETLRFADVNLKEVALLTNYFPPSLKELRLEGTNLKSIEPICNLKSLESLSLIFNKFEHIDCLANLVNLRPNSLFLHGNHLTDVKCPLPDKDGLPICVF